MFIAILILYPIILRSILRNYENLLIVVCVTAVLVQTEVPQLAGVAGRCLRTLSDPQLSHPTLKRPP